MGDQAAQAEAVDQGRGSDRGTGAAPSLAALSQRFAEVAAAALRRREAGPEGLRRAFRRDREATLRELYPLARSWCREQIRGYLRAPGCVAAADRGRSTAVDAAAFLDPTYLERVVHLTLELALVNRAAPALLVSPVPLPELAALMAGRPAVAVLFDHPLAIAHELYPLWTDAYVNTGSAPGAPELVGVHLSWLDPELRAGRAIVFDPRADIFLEAPLAVPQPLSFALLLCQSRRAHRELSARLAAAALPHLNVYQGAAEAADDKWTCFRRWQQHGVATPPTCLLEQGQIRDAVRRAIDDFLQQHRASGAGWVVQPRRGTEGEKVSWVPPGDRARVVDDVLTCWEEIAHGDDAVLRPRVGLVGMRTATDREARPFDIRLHVAWDGTARRAESGYLLVAPAPDAPIAAVAQGGQIQPLTALDGASLVRLQADAAAAAGVASRPAPDRCPASRARVVWGLDALAAARELAVRSVAAVGPLALAGVDIKLDYRDGRLAPSVLDVNPRPAGLLHSDLIEGNDGAAGASEAGIAAGLWRGVAEALRR